VNLTQCKVLKIVVGQNGATASSCVGGGGGGSFVSLLNNSPLIVAGGGGASNNNSPVFKHGQTSVTGGTTTSTAGALYQGTVDVNGNGSLINYSYVSGAGGFNTNGSTNPNAIGGQAFINGALGGGGTHQGGFGGGGAASLTGWCRFGGGGGYTGGASGLQNISAGAFSAGGGGSFNSGTNQVNTSGTNATNGLVIITQLFSAAISQPSLIACNGNSTAVLSATINGGQAPYTYTWLPTGGNTSVASGLGAGVYTLNFSDNNSQNGSATYTVTEPGLISGSVVASNNETCYGDADGSATITAIGGTAPFTYTWSPTGGNTVTATGLSAGVYSVSIDDNNGCPTGMMTLTITSPAQITGTASSNPVCPGNTVSLTGVGATSYTWSGSVVDGAAFTPTATASYTVAGTNSVTSCTGSAVITVTVDPVATLSAANSTICSGMNATIVPTGGANYTISGGSAVVSPSATTIYTISGTSAAGCPANSGTVSITVIPCTGIENNLSDNYSLKIYPNPNNGEFTIDAGQVELSSIEIKDVTGKILISKSVSNLNANVNILNYPNGVYFIKIETSHGNQTFKMIKQ
ncbi:MAG: T9SS type A sorting domain-containing protein, partial [Bacteroidia bacterium]